MASFLTAPGPVEHFVKFRDGTTSYLGTAVTAPEVEARHSYLPVVNDLGGRTNPMDRVFDRSSHVISTVLNRFDWAVYKTLERAAVTGGPGVQIDNTLTHGILTSGIADFELILVFANVGSAVVADPQFPKGRRYYSCLLMGARESTVGTRTQEVAMVFEAQGLFVPASRTWRLYTELTSGVTDGLPSVS